MAGYAGRGTIFQIGNGTTATATNISGVTVSSGVATVTSTAHGLATNDVVLIAAVGGVVGVNDYHMVRVTGANAFTLPGAFGVSGTYTSGGTVQLLNTSWVTVAALLNGTSAEEGDDVDVSAVDTPAGFREFAAGMKSGSWSINGNFLPNDASHGMITGLYRISRLESGTWFRTLFPQAAGTDNPGKAWFGLLQSISHNWDAEGKVELQCSGRMNRAPVFKPGT